MNRLNEQYFKTKEIHKKNFKKQWWILWIVLLTAFFLYIYSEINTQIKYPGILIIAENNQVCIPTDELKVGNILYETQLDQLQSPDSTQMDSILNVRSWFYPNILIETVNDHIINIKALNNKVSTPSGLTIGQTKTKVSQILYGQKSDFKSKAKYLENIQFVNCETERYLALEFQADTLSNLQIGIDLP
ncbi:hypothetical protein ACE1ET_20570 [Saccharicrinis sp. FJH62]|uniref:hypothetical protein n=1 Tax=Saccharicrinis sp. FJH62 TaxID=3344657 RepID=UPI0035D4B517